ncbi:MAG: ROK family protein [Candidatus Sulfotelmatobacter sp.]|jgi:glucokinase
MPDFSIAVDLGGTNLRIAAISAEGQLLEKVTLATKLALGPHDVIDQMCDAILRLSAKYKRSGKLLGAGLGIPGIIDMQTGTVRKSANLPGWEDYPVRAEIELRLGLPRNGLSKNVLAENAGSLALENDANMAALGEQWLGAARGVENMAMITLGTGIGGAIVLGGKIWHGMNGMAGEFGHVTVEPEGHPCGCGSHGCAERYASASAIMRMAREAIASGKAPSLAQAASAGAELDAQSIYNLAIQGDEPAQRIFHTFGRYLGIMLAGAVNVLNLDMYVIGGGVSSAWDAFAPTMFQELRQRSIVYAATAPDDVVSAEETATMWGQPPSAVQAERSSAAAGSHTERKTVVTRALLGSDAGLYGAARAAVLVA